MDLNSRKDWIFLCDAGYSVGLGHLSRCLGIAESFVDNHQTCSFYGDFSSIAKQMLNEAGFDYLIADPIGQYEWAETGPLSLARNVVLDSYLATKEDLSILSKYIEPGKLVVVDDFGSLGGYDCHAVINFTFRAESLDKASQPYRSDNRMPMKFLGPQFFPARRWMRKVRGKRTAKVPDKIKKVLVIAGGQDSTSTTIHMLDVLGQLEMDLEVAVLVNQEYRTQPTFESRLNSFKKVHELTPPTDLCDWYLWADICFCGGGLIKYECLFVGLSVAAVSRTTGQQKDSDELSTRKLICDLGLVTEIEIPTAKSKLEVFFNDVSLRQHAVEHGRKLLESEEVGSLLEQSRMI